MTSYCQHNFYSPLFPNHNSPILCEPHYLKHNFPVRNSHLRECFLLPLLTRKEQHSTMPTAPPSAAGRSSASARSQSRATASGMKTSPSRSSPWTAAASSVCSCGPTRPRTGTNNAFRPGESGLCNFCTGRIFAFLCEASCAQSGKICPNGARCGGLYQKSASV